MWRMATRLETAAIKHKPFVNIKLVCYIHILLNSRVFYSKILITFLILQCFEFYRIDTLKRIRDGKVKQRLLLTLRAGLPSSQNLYSQTGHEYE